MSRFLDQLVVSPLADGLQWVLMADFRYQSDIGDVTITVPKGFITDFASIPRQLWALFPPWQRYGAAAIIHDHEYWKNFLSREEADNVLREAMQVLGVDNATIVEIYTAVRAFGQGAWDHNRQLKASGYTRQASPASNPPYAAI